MISFINKGVTKLQNIFLKQKMNLSARLKVLLIFITAAVYSGIFFLISDPLGVSINFFVLIPMFIAASLFHFWGGVISGIIALPLNLLLLWIQDKIESAPASLLTAQLFGVVTGAVLGFLSSFYIRLRKEIREHETARVQKQLLLREGHHRIKNNLAIITGIIELELLEEKDPKQEEFLQNLIDRIRSVSVTQNLIYGIDDINKVEMHSFISKLIDQITLSVAIREQGINFLLSIDKVILPIDEALPLGLIVYETCTNSIKYAFENTEKPVIAIKLTSNGSGRVLRISDNGPGIPESVMTGGSDSIGLNLIEKLVKQINASFRLKNENGAVLEVCIHEASQSN